MHYRAMLENHALLKPALISVAGTIGILIVGILVWRRAPQPIVTAGSSLYEEEPSFGREIAITHSFPALMFVLAITPLLNFFAYTGHGGPAWFLLPFCFPWVLARLFFKVAVGPTTRRNWFKDFFKTTVPLYIAFSLPLSWAATASIRMVMGLQVSPWIFFAVMVSPFPWWYFT